MRHRPKLCGPLPWLLVAALALLPAMAAPRDDDKATVAAVVDAFHAALAAGDRAGALSRLAAEVQIFEAGGAERSRDEYASHHLAGDMEYVAATRTELLSRTVEVAGDTAWVLTLSKTTGTFKGKAVSSRGAETMLLRRGAEGWKIVHVHWSSRPVPAGG